MVGAVAVVCLTRPSVLPVAPHPTHVPAHHAHVPPGPSSRETGACRRLHILERLQVAARKSSAVQLRDGEDAWSLPLRGVRKAVGGLMWPMGGRHAAETEAVAVAGQEPAHRTARLIPGRSVSAPRATRAKTCL